MLLGPDGVGLVPEPSAWVMVGNLGLVFLVMEGGLHIDVSSLRRVGPIAVVIAVAGTILPIALGTGYMVAAGYDPETGVAAGTSLSSTSIGMATAMMGRVGELNTPSDSHMRRRHGRRRPLPRHPRRHRHARHGCRLGCRLGRRRARRAPVLVSLAVVLLGRLAFAIVPTLSTPSNAESNPNTDETQSSSPCSS